MHRRTFLRSAGAAVALPFLEQFAPAFLSLQGVRALIADYERETNS